MNLVAQRFDLGGDDHSGDLLKEEVKKVYEIAPPILPIFFPFNSIKGIVGVYSL
jgi:hypothetical protein